ncbi:FkbM family methyltransferase [Hoeflea sp. CAU 1731]
MRQGLDTVSDFGDHKPGLLPTVIWRLATHKMIGQQQRKVIRKRFARRFQGPFDVEAEGVRMRAYPFENYCDRTVVGRKVLPEIPERRLIASIIKPGMVFVDIGANVGSYSMFVAKACGDHARILAFEPHPRTFSKLVFNLEANGFRSVEAINRGTGPKSQRLKLYSSGGTNIGTASLHSDAIDARDHVEIKITPLSEALVLRNIDRVDLLKIDVEGYEDQALLPLMVPEHKSLWPKAILIETVLRRLWKIDCVEQLESLGYRIAGATSENTLLTLSADDREA